MVTDKIERVREKIDEIVSMSPYPEDIFHSINTYEWVLKLDPKTDTDIALMISALGHDIERGLEDRRVKASGHESFDEFKQAHALNSAEILVELLEENGVEQELIDDVAHLVANHEVGGDEREDLLMYADVLSFFHVCLPLYFDRRGPETTMKRCVWGYKKLSANLRKLLREIEFMDDELKELIMESIGPDNDKS